MLQSDYCPYCSCPNKTRIWINIPQRVVKLTEPFICDWEGSQKEGARGKHTHYTHTVIHIFLILNGKTEDNIKVQLRPYIDADTLVVTERVSLPNKYTCIYYSNVNRDYCCLQNVNFWSVCERSARTMLIKCKGKMLRRQKTSTKLHLNTVPSTHIYTLSEAPQTPSTLPRGAQCVMGFKYPGWSPRFGDAYIETYIFLN